MSFFLSLSLSSNSFFLSLFLTSKSFCLSLASSAILTLNSSSGQNTSVTDSSEGESGVGVGEVPAAAAGGDVRGVLTGAVGGDFGKVPAEAAGAGESMAETARGETPAKAAGGAEGDVPAEAAGSEAGGKQLWQLVEVQDHRDQQMSADLFWLCVLQPEHNPFDDDWDLSAFSVEVAVEHEVQSVEILGSPTWSQV